MEKFLAFDASGDMLIVGCFNGLKYFEKREIGGGTEKLLPMIDAVLTESKTNINEIEIVCVGVGPGSWTGSRVSVVTSYGFNAGKNELKFLKFNAFDLISYNGNENKKVVKLVKAFANFVYVQDFDGNIFASTKDEVKETFKDAKFISASEIFDGVQVVDVNLEKLAKKLVAEKSFVDISEIEPMYLRKSQAEYQMDEKSKLCGAKDGNKKS